LDLDGDRRDRGGFGAGRRVTRAVGALCIFAVDLLVIYALAVHGGKTSKPTI
jgi:hypothetical protein